MVDKVIYGQDTINDFLEQLAREAPTLPAGGCAVALAGALAAALERFVARLTLRRHSDPDARKRLTGILSRLECLQEKCVEIMDRDVKEYERVLKALQMPKATEDEKAEKEAALQKAKVAALSTPMVLAECGLEMLQWSRGLIEEGYQVALADAGVAAEMAHACLWGGLWMARANLLGITDHSFVEQHQQLIKNLQTKAEDLYKKIKERLKEQLEISD
jgi:formiminotetrahydrofolate cyclodeaminase